MKKPFTTKIGISKVLPSLMPILSLFSVASMITAPAYALSADLTLAEVAGAGYGDPTWEVYYVDHIRNTRLLIETSNAPHDWSVTRIHYNFSGGYATAHVETPVPFPNPNDGCYILYLYDTGKLDDNGNICGGLYSAQIEQ